MRVGDRVRLRETTPWAGRTGEVLREVGYRPCARGGVWEVRLEGSPPLYVIVFGDECEPIDAAREARR